MWYRNASNTSSTIVANIVIVPEKTEELFQKYLKQLATDEVDSWFNGAEFKHYSYDNYIASFGGNYKQESIYSFKKTLPEISHEVAPVVAEKYNNPIVTNRHHSISASDLREFFGATKLSKEQEDRLYSYWNSGG